MLLEFFCKYKYVLILVLACLLVALLLIVESDWPGKPPVEKNPDSIAIPGYEVLELAADKKEQAIRLPNPEQNCCYFQISLYLEDGTLLWQSELIEPGKTSKPLTLVNGLEAGTYPNAVLRYACYRMDESLTPLNGAETKVTLRVK